MKNRILFSIFSLAIIISSCGKDDNIVNTIPETVQKIKLSEGYSSGTKIELYSDDTLRVGYNQLYIRVLDSASQAVIRDARLECTPLMDMGTMSHSCPTEQTPSEQITGDLFPIAAVFTMASIGSYKWSINVGFRNQNSNKDGIVSLPVSVLQGGFAPQSFVDADGNSMIAAMLPIAKPVVGMNNAEFVVYRNTLNGYIAADDMTMEIIPEMPSMGHGSPNNVNPVSIGKGHYTGKVNFIMTGEWKITLVLNRNGTELGQPFFWITL